MDIAEIKQGIANGRFRLSLHAEIEAETDNLDIAQIVEAILHDDILGSIQTLGAAKAVW